MDNPLHLARGRSIISIPPNTRKEDNPKLYKRVGTCEWPFCKQKYSTKTMHERRKYCKTHQERSEH